MWYKKQINIYICLFQWNDFIFMSSLIGLDHDFINNLLVVDILHMIIFNRVLTIYYIYIYLLLLTSWTYGWAISSSISYLSFVRIVWSNSFIPLWRQAISSNNIDKIWQYMQILTKIGVEMYIIHSFHLDTRVNMYVDKHVFFIQGWEAENVV